MNGMMSVDLITWILFIICFVFGDGRMVMEEHLILDFNWYYIMAGHAIVVVRDITLLFYHGNAVILTLL